MFIIHLYVLQCLFYHKVFSLKNYLVRMYIFSLAGMWDEAANVIEEIV